VLIFLEKFRNWFELIWNSFAKILKETNLKTEKEKKTKQKKVKRPGGSLPADTSQTYL
jgi:hypothetical protein